MCTEDNKTKILEFYQTFSDVKTNKYVVKFTLFAIFRKPRNFPKQKKILNTCFIDDLLIDINIIF